VGFGSPAKDVSLAQQLAVSAGSIGLRTQSITLMRDALYRICELYLNGAISEAAAVQLLQRSQDLSLGILAIEQLTGAVVAQQVNLTTSSSASSIAASKDMSKALERAQANEVRKKDANEAAQAALEAQKAVVAQKKVSETLAKKNAEPSLAAIARSEKDISTERDKINAAIKSRIDANVAIASLGVKLAALQKTASEPIDPEKLASIRTEITQTEGRIARARKVVTKAGDDIALAQEAIEASTASINKTKLEPVQVAYDAAAADLKAANEELKRKQDTADVAKAEFEQAQGDVDQVADSGSTANSSANATGSGAGAFSTSTNRYGVNKYTADVLSRATTEIVKAVLYKPHLTDSCVVMLMGHAKEQQIYERIAAFCSEIIAATLEVYRRPPNPDASPADLAQPTMPAAPAATPQKR
jgi:hypothetical protein